MKKKLLAGLAAGLFIVGLVEMAGATIVTTEFSATVTLVQNAPVHGLVAAVGDTVLGNFSYDTNFIDTDPSNPDRGIYYGGSASLLLNGSLITSSSAPALYVYQSDLSNDIFSIIDGSQSGNPFFIDGIPQTEGYFYFGFTTSVSDSFLTDDSLPDAQSLERLLISQFGIHEPSGNRWITFDNVTSMTVTATDSVPEPATMLLFGTGIAGLAGSRIKRKKKQ